MQSSATQTVFVSFETLRPPAGADHFVPAHTLRPNELLSRLKPLTASASATPGQQPWTQTPRTLLIIDTLHPLLASSSIENIASYLSTLINPTTSLLAVYHASQPLSASSDSNSNPHAPHPLTLLAYTATTILHVHSLHHIIAAKAARDRSRAAPAHGLDEAEEGTVQGLGANDPRGTVVEAEVRRRSGRTVELWFVLDGPASASARGGVGPNAEARGKANAFPGITLLEEHPLYAAPPMLGAEAERKDKGEESEHGEVSFNLGLTEKQRLDREGVVLPYHDAQGDGMGMAGEGGRILYDMGSEDDFDDEEDEL